MILQFGEEYFVKKMLLRPFFFCAKKEYWCVVRNYVEQVHHYYWGCKDLHKQQIMYTFSTEEEAINRLKEITNAS